MTLRLRSTEHDGAVRCHVHLRLGGSQPRHRQNPLRHLVLLYLYDIFQYISWYFTCILHDISHSSSKIGRESLGASLTDPFVAPLHATTEQLRGLPPCLGSLYEWFCCLRLWISVGGAEMLRSSIEGVARTLFSHLSAGFAFKAHQACHFQCIFNAFSL